MLPRRTSHGLGRFSLHNLGGWATVLTSALVAAFVTLLIEFMAKPRLEARKERIVEEYSNTRALIRALNLCQYHIGRFVVHLDSPSRTQIDHLLFLNVKEDLSSASVELQRILLEGELRIHYFLENLLEYFCESLYLWRVLEQQQVQLSEIEELFVGRIEPLCDLLAEVSVWNSWIWWKKAGYLTRLQEIRNKGSF
jgi:hypothetical protein